MSRDEQVYKDPETFNPDRFLDPQVPQLPAFGFGRRYVLLTNAVQSRTHRHIQPLPRDPLCRGVHFHRCRLNTSRI